MTTRVAVVGGGIAGATIALRLGLAGVEAAVFERRTSLVHGPPMCHLHAGGALYPELPDDECRTLLRQCVDMARLHPLSIDHRPTFVSVPRRDGHDPERLVARERMLQAHYRQLVADDADHASLGQPEDYLRVLDRGDLARLASREPTPTPHSWAQWLAPVARLVSLDELRWPSFAVAEPSWNILRLAACSMLQLAALPTVQLRLGTTVTGLQRHADGWLVTHAGPTGDAGTVEVDLVVNAAGFRTGAIDDLAHLPAQHAVEFKAAWLTRWHRPTADTRALPELVFHGPRGTAQGMAQFTPYAGDIVQLHGMAPSITLFADRPSSSGEHSAQPPLRPEWLRWIDEGFDPAVALERGARAIAHVSPFVPSFADAQALTQVLGGAQQVPGGDVSKRSGRLRTEPGRRYLVAENAKASEALDLADGVLDALTSEGLIDAQQAARPVHWPQLEDEVVTRLARRLARERGLPEVMAERTAPTPPTGEVG